MPSTSHLDWLSSTTAMIVLFWSRATRDLLKSFGWGIAALHRLHAATKLPFPRRPPHRISPSHPKRRFRAPPRCYRPPAMTQDVVQAQGSVGDAEPCPQGRFY